MNKRDYAFDRTNFILLAAGMVVVIIGFILMSGGSSTEEAFNPDIFGTMRTKIAPVVCLIGFLSLIYGIVRKPKDTDPEITTSLASTNSQTGITTPDSQKSTISPANPTDPVSISTKPAKLITNNKNRKK